MHQDIDTINCDLLSDDFPVTRQLYLVQPVMTPYNERIKDGITRQRDEYSWMTDNSSVVEFDDDGTPYIEECFTENPGYSNLFGRRKEAKAKGLKGKALRDEVKRLRKEDKGKSKSEKKALKKTRKDDFNQALVEGKVKKNALIRKIQKFNPVAAATRGTVLTALRLNIFGISSRLYPALLSDAEAKKKNFDVSNLPKARKALLDFKAFYMKIGGDPNRLAVPIQKAHDKPVFNTKKAKARKAAEKAKGIDGVLSRVYVSEPEVSNVAGADDAAVGTVAALATATATVISSFLNKAGASKNPYTPGSKEAQNFDTSGTDAPPPDADADKMVADAQKAAAQDKANGLPLDTSTGDDTILGMSKTTFGIVATVVVVAIIAIAIKAKGNSAASPAATISK